MEVTSSPAPAWPSLVNSTNIQEIKGGHPSEAAYKGLQRTLSIITKQRSGAWRLGGIRLNSLVCVFPPPHSRRVFSFLVSDHSPTLGLVCFPSPRMSCSGLSPTVFSLTFPDARSLQLLPTRGVCVGGGAGSVFSFLSSSIPHHSELSSPFRTEWGTI